MMQYDSVPAGLIRFRCPRCGKGVGAKPHLAGATVKCPTCGEPVLAPSAASAATTPAAPPQDPARAERGIWRAGAIADARIEHVEAVK